MQRYVRLTEIEKIPNAAASKRIAEVQEEAYRLSTKNKPETEEIEEGSYEWYMNLGVTPPEGLKPKQQEPEITELSITLNIHEDYDFEYDEILLDTSLIEKVSEWKDFNNSSIIFLSNGEEMLVTQTIDELEKLLNT